MPDRPLAAGDPVVDFTLRDTDGALCETADARRRGLLMFAFWKQGCGTCQYTFPFLQRFQELYAGPGFALWGVAQETAEDAEAFALRYGSTFQQLPDLDLAATAAYGITNVPTIYLVDAGDTILRSAQAFITDELNAMARLVAERTGRPYTPVVRAEDNAPALRPG